MKMTKIMLLDTYTTNRCTTSLKKFQWNFHVIVHMYIGRTVHVIFKFVAWLACPTRISSLIGTLKIDINKYDRYRSNVHVGHQTTIHVLYVCLSHCYIQHVTCGTDSVINPSVRYINDQNWLNRASIVSYTGPEMCTNSPKLLLAINISIFVYYHLK